MEEVGKGINQLGRVDLSLCYQCQKCASGCPLAFAMDYLPHQIIRLLQYGFKERVLASKTIWLCSSCETCYTRCPNEIDLVRLMDSLRQMAISSSIPLGEKNIPLFHSLFLEGIKRKGRIHELEMIARYKAKSKEWLKDLRLGLRLFKRRKLKLFSPKLRKLKEIEEIFKETPEGRLR